MKPNTSNFLFRHPWDRYAFPGFVALIWFVILMGFVPDIIHKFRRQGFNYPLAVHIHAAVYVSWLVLLTVQTVLIGRGRVAVQIPRHAGPRFHVMSGRYSTACRATVPRQAGPVRER